MKTIRFFALAAFLVSILHPAPVNAQADRAKGLARRVAPSSRPGLAPYPQRTPINPASRYPTPRAAQPSPTPTPPPASVETPTPQPVAPSRMAPATVVAPVLRTPAAPSEPAKAQGPSEETVRKTVEFQKKRAEEGSSVAQYDLGMRYLKGDGVEKDEAAAKKWLEKSAKDGNTQAAKKLKELEAGTK